MGWIAEGGSRIIRDRIRSTIHDPRSTLPLLLVLVGCKTGTLPDPNDPNNPGMMQADVLRRNVGSAAEKIFDRVNTGEITDTEGHELLRKYANTMLDDVNIPDVEPETAWEYAEVMKTAERWKDAQELLKMAVKADPPDDWDRIVNDRLRLAVVEAKLGEIPQAIADVRETFKAPPEGKVPIIYAVLLEMAPQVLGKGHDKEFADLLVEAADQAGQAKVDANTEPGKLFLMARPTHQRNALLKAEEIYRQAGDTAAVERISQKLLSLPSERIR